MSIKLYTMTCGYVTMEAGFFLRGGTGKLTVPVPSYLVVHPKGTVLFDSGLERDLATNDEDQVTETLGWLTSILRTTMEPGTDVATRLEGCDILPEKIDYLVNSHLHFDHCGGNALIKNARLIVQRREWTQACSPECQDEKGGYTKRHFDLGHDRIEIDGDYDIFGDGSVMCIPSYGHTAGHQSLKIKLEDGEVVLTADACYMRKALDNMLLPDEFATNDADNLLKTFAMFKRLERAGAHLIFGHDPDQWPLLNQGPVRQTTIKDIIASRDALSAGVAAQ